MARVEGTFPDVFGYQNKSNFVVESDQAMNPFTWMPPIHWTGYVKGTKVSFIQVESSGYSREDYNFEGFPVELQSAIPYIIEAIDRAMKVMD